MTVQVDVQVAAAEAAPGAAMIRGWAAAALAHHHDDGRFQGGRRAPSPPQADAELSVRLVDEAEMAQLNQKYRGRDGATNALSFPAELPPGVDAPLLGDIAACPAVIAREADAQGKTTEQHWAHVIVHGVLHLLGYDHAAADEARRMEAMEADILAGLGFPSPYEMPEQSPPGSFAPPTPRSFAPPGTPPGAPLGAFAAPPPGATSFAAT